MWCWEVPRRGRSLCLLTSTLVLAAGLAIAEDEAPRFVVTGEFLDESFDNGIPPTGWTRTNASSIPFTWHGTTQAPYLYSGKRSAYVDVRSDAGQNERLDTPGIDLSSSPATGLYLSFWWYSDPFWFREGGRQFLVRATLDGSSWTTVWSLDDVAGSGWQWRNALVDLSSWAGQSGTFQLRFQYLAEGAARFAMDDVRLGYLTPPGPPANDTCAGALADLAQFGIGPAAGEVLVQGNNTFATADYGLDASGSCTGYRHTGRDLVWVLDVPADHHVIANMLTAGGWDDSLFLLTNCADPGGSCLSGSRAFPTGSTVVHMNATASTQRYYLVASAYDTGVGEFSLSVSIEKGVSIETESWGAVKARYR